MGHIWCSFPGSRTCNGFFSCQLTKGCHQQMQGRWVHGCIRNNYFFNLCTFALLVLEWVESYLLSLLLVQSMEWRQLIYGFWWKVCPRVFASYKSASPIYFLEGLSCCQIVITNKIEPKELNHNRCKLLPTTPCNIVGQGRAVVVVINAPYPSLSLKNRPKESNYNHQPPKWQLCINTPWKDISWTIMFLLLSGLKSDGYLLNAFGSFFVHIVML